MSTLDRHIARTALARLVVLLALGTFLLVLGHFIGKGGYATVFADPERRWLPLEYYALRLPEFILNVLPLATAAAALFTAMPMLRQGTLVALSASGIAPRRVFASLIVISVIAGAVSVVLRDQVVPRLIPRAALVDELMDRKRSASEDVGRPARWSDGDSRWSAAVGYPSLGTFAGLALFTVGEPRRIAFAKRLDWVEAGLRPAGWQLSGVEVIEGSRIERRERCTPRDIGFTLDVDRRALALRLLSGEAKTSRELLASPGGVKAVTVRAVSALLPLLCLLFALPRFIRWEGRARIGLTTVSALLWATAPLIAILLLNRLLISSAASPVALGGILSAALVGVGAWRWWRMRL